MEERRIERPAVASSGPRKISEADTSESRVPSEAGGLSILSSSVTRSVSSSDKPGRKAGCAPLKPFNAVLL
jgi:hypothetical protein